MTNRQVAYTVVACARVLGGIVVACALMVLGGGRDVDEMAEVKAALDRLDEWLGDLGADRDGA